MFLSRRRQGDQEKRRLFLVPYEVQMRHLIFTPGDVEFSLFKMSLSDTAGTPKLLNITAFRRVTGIYFNPESSLQMLMAPR